VFFCNLKNVMPNTIDGRRKAAGEAKSAVYDCLVPYDDTCNYHGNQSKSLDMLQLLLLDYIALIAVLRR